MKNLDKMTKAIPNTDDEEDSRGEPKSAAGKIMQAVAKAAQTTPGKSGKKATKGPKTPSKPSSPRQKKAFKKSNKVDIPHGASKDDMDEIE